MNYLSAEQLSKSFNDKWLFRDLTFGILEGDKVALVGENGAGKSTLLKILTSQIAPDTGHVTLRQGVRIGYLGQQPQAEDHLSVKEILFDADNPVANAVLRYEDCLHDPNTSADAMQEALDEMEALNAWEFDAKVKEVTGKLGVENFDALFSTLSGGQRKRVFMARMLLQDPGLIVMDEPTNHLDLEAIEWLENYLSGQNITLIMVTHDRYFLDNVASVIVELDRGKLFTYKGNYAYFLEKKSEREEMLRTEVSRARNLLKKELEWMRRQPKARGTKAKYRVEAFYELQEKASVNLKKDRLELDIKETRQGGKVLELHHLKKAYGPRKIISDFSYIFKKKDRIGVVGNNGVGKSTFLDLLTGKVKPDSGEVLPGQTTKIGYFTQEATALKPDNRVIEEVLQIAEFITLADGSQVSASGFLSQFLFPPEKQYNVVAKLSGGEKKRLQLLKVLIANPNFLILDEPTNDFDIDTLNVLEDFLEKFSGCLLLVSHDRYFMDHLVNQLFVFTGDGELKVINGNYSDYRAILDEQNLKVTPRANEIKANAGNGSSAEHKRKLSHAERQEHQSLYADIEKLEGEKKMLIDQLSSGQLENDELIKCSVKIKDLTEAIEFKTMRWLELEELDR